MHASLAFVNGAGNKRRGSGPRIDPEGLRLLNALLSTATAEAPRVAKGPALDKSNPNEVRARHLHKIKP
jgi:hypothetical protein